MVPSCEPSYSRSCGPPNTGAIHLRSPGFSHQPVVIHITSLLSEPVSLPLQFIGVGHAHLCPKTQFVVRCDKDTDCISTDNTKAKPTVQQCSKNRLAHGSYNDLVTYRPPSLMVTRFWTTPGLPEHTFVARRPQYEDRFSSISAHCVCVPS